MIDPVEVRTRLAAVVAAMQQSGAWQVERPADAAFIDMGAFGTRTMALEQWLRFVFVPNVEALVADGGPWPAQSQVAAVAGREGDTNPAVAAVVPALAAFDALFSDAGATGHANELGWALLARAGHTREETEAAVACFRSSIAHDRDVPKAVANLGNALVELGREAEAIAEIEPLATGDGALAATAHNWLGWRLIERDRTRAIAHLREATRLRPTWGVAWQNLARALDAGDELAELAEACRAYGEAIACGDAHDDAFARDRRLQLEMRLLGAGASVPPVPEAARADSAAFAVVRAAAAQLPAPHVFMIRPTSRDVPYAVIGTVVGGRALGHSIVGASRDMLSATTLVRGDDALCFETTHIPVAEAQRAAAALVARLAALEPAALTPIDAAMYLCDVVLATLPGRWLWSLAGYRPAAVAAGTADGAIRLVATARAGDGIDLALPAPGVDQPGASLAIEAPAQLLERSPAILEAVRAAIAAREAFARRPFGIHHAAALLAIDGLREPTFYESYPAAPRAWLGDARDGLAIVHLTESADGIAIDVGRTHWHIRTRDELVALVPELAAAVATDRERLRAERLVEGARYRVREPFAGLSAGTVVELASIRIVSREAERAYTFRAGAREVTLEEPRDDDLAILAAIDRYLAPA